MKDYYAILGVVPSAEDVVIRAAWKALVHRYHPDRFAGDVAKANTRIVEINEAYNALSNPAQRKAYDKSREGKESNFGDWVHEEEAGEAAGNTDSFEKDWALAIGYYPDLVDINNQLSEISHLLAFSYRAGLLERKAFKNRKELAETAEKSFLQLYFGSNPVIVAFAKELIFTRNKAAAKALNDVIRVLGSDISPEAVINKICKDFNTETFETEEMKEQRLRKEACGKW